MPDPLAKYDAIFQAAGKEWNVDPVLLKAMATQESQGDPRATSKAGARGLLQIMPDTAKALGITDITDPVQNIFGGAKYMNEALDAEKDPTAALLYYHGGPKWRDKMGTESRGYVPAISKNYQTLTQTASQPMAVGDSLAQGVAQAGKMEANATQGVSPQKVLGTITGPAMGSVLNRDVILSSGASNDPANPANGDTIAEQIAELNYRGARSVTLLGVGDHPKFAGINDTLAAIAQKTGARFVPIDPAMLAADRVHPKDLTAYRSLLAPPRQQTAQNTEGQQ